MKYLLGCLMFILLSTIIISCAPTQKFVITSHEQVMDGYKTKDQVIARFGMPTSRRTDIGLEEWTYDYGTKSVTKKNASLSGVLHRNNTIIGTSRDGSASGNSNSESGDVKIFVKFTFKVDSAINWTTRGGLNYGFYTAVIPQPKVVPKKEHKKKKKKKGIDDPY